MKKTLKYKFIHWIHRYGFAEVLALFTTLLFAIPAHFLFYNLIITAFAGTLGDNIGFYGYIFYKEFQNKNYKGTPSQKFYKQVRNIFIEFGPSEFFDSFLIRPFCLYITPLFLGNLMAGIILGKFIADLSFYIITIFFYELRKKYFKD